MKKDEVLEHFVRITNGKFSCYSESFRTISNGYFFIAKQNGVKNLIVIAKKGICNKFELILKKKILMYLFARGTITIWFP